MHRIIRTALASLGAAVVVAGGSLGVAYATAPASAPAQTPASDTDQVAALNHDADDLLTKIAALEKQLSSMPTQTSSPSELTKQELAEPTAQAPVTGATAPRSQTTRTTAQAPLPAAAPSSAPRGDGQGSQNEDHSND
jgi:hypothetical protein